MEVTPLMPFVNVVELQLPQEYLWEEQEEQEEQEDLEEQEELEELEEEL